MDKNLLMDMIEESIKDSAAVTIHGSVIQPTSTQILECDGSNIRIKLPYEDNGFIQGVVKLSDLTAIIKLPLTFEDYYNAILEKKKKAEEELKARIEEGKKEAKRIEDMDRPQKEGKE